MSIVTAGGEPVKITTTRRPARAPGRYDLAALSGRVAALESRRDSLAIRTLRREVQLLDRETVRGGPWFTRFANAEFRLRREELRDA